MNTSWFDFGFRQIACTSITGYQKYLSPHKGFSCAHRILYGGESCSGYIKRMVAQKGVKAAFRESHQRFQECKLAHQILRGMVNSQTEEQNNPQKRQRVDRKKRDVCSDAIANSCADCHCSDTSKELPCPLLDCGNCLHCASSLNCCCIEWGSCGS